MSGWLIIVPSYLMGAAPAIVVAHICRKRARLGAASSLLLILPLPIWAALSVSVGPGGTLANALVEPLTLGVVVLVLQCIRLVVAKIYPSTARAMYILSLIGSVVSAVAIALLFPDIPE
jgi:hypothetical protein